MQYILLIYGPEQAMATMKPDDLNAMMADYGAFSQELKKSGKLIAGDRLKPVHTATTVRIRDGKTTTTDGPFAETREQLGGYYLVEAKDLDEARAIAAKCPGARFGSIEVRPIHQM